MNFSKSCRAVWVMNVAFLLLGGNACAQSLAADVSESMPTKAGGETEVRSNTSADAATEVRDNAARDSINSSNANAQDNVQLILDENFPIAAPEITAPVAAPAPVPVAAPAPVAANAPEEPKENKPRPTTEIRSDEYQIGVAVMDNNRPGKALKFGKFNGLTDKTGYLIGNAHTQFRNGSSYWNIDAHDIDLDNRGVSIDGGTMDKYKLHLAYSELDSLISSNSQTPFLGADSDRLTLPAGFVKGANTGAMTELAASMHNVDLGTQRKEGDASIAFATSKNTELSFSFRRYLKDGIKPLGSLAGSMTSLNQAQALVLPEPVNYQTDEFRTWFDWHGERGRANIEYYYSRFTNAYKSLTWDNPYNTGAFGETAIGRNSLPPDNQHQRLAVSGSYELPARTRVTAQYERGSMTQNEPFLPYTSNTASVIATPLPRSSPDARIDTTLIKLDVSTQPLKALSLHAGYQQYKTDNKTPRDLYQMVVNDTGNQVGAGDLQAQYTHPYDSKRSQLKFDGSYYFGKGATLKLGMGRDTKAYSYRAVKETVENSFSARLNKRWASGATVFLNLAEARKRSDGYDATRVFNSTYTNAGFSGLLSNLAAMRQFDIAERNSSRQGLGVTLVPRQNWTVGLNADHNGEKYNASQYGLQDRQVNTATLNTSYAPDEFTSWSLFYTRQQSDWRQASNAGAADWSALNKDAIDTVGANILLSFMGDRLPVRLGYAYANSNTDISFTSVPTPLSMPTIKGVRHTADLSGTYSLSDSMSIRAGALLEFFRCTDWATDGIPPGSPIAPKLLTLSGSETPYRAILLTTALNYHF